MRYFRKRPAPLRQRSGLKRRGNLAFSLLLGFFYTVGASALSAVDDKSTAMATLTEQGLLQSPALVGSFYSDVASRVWNESRRASLLIAVHGSRRHGLRPEFYHLSALENSGPESWQLDILATDAYLTLAAHLSRGRLDPVSLEPTWSVGAQALDLVAHLRHSLTSDDLAGELDRLAPSQPRYRRLTQALAHYERIALEGGWPKVAEGPLLKPGAISDRVRTLRARLVASGDVAASTEAGDNYDAELVQAVRTFQQRANLEPDGIVGPATLNKLNLSADYRVQQIKVNLERWRWLPESLGNKHIRVNIADYRLEAHEGSEITEIYDVVVGRTYRQTPIFSGKMSYLVLNPWWETPSKLARQDLLPKFQSNPAIFEEMGYQVLDRNGQVVDPATVDWRALSKNRFPYRVRQLPGDKNALGRVKFMFPNPYEVYLHDTPSRDLFSKTRRDFSSGCIRVKDPIELAEWVLSETPGWTPERLRKEVESGKETTVRLKQVVPVHLLYWTVVVNDETGDIRFIEDIYERDAKVLAALNDMAAR